MDNTKIGHYGEDLACEFLGKNGYRILERNYRIKGGEIDIVAKDGNTLVFVEVKTRWSHKFGSPVESMSPWKIRSLLKTARFYIQKINWGDREYRLDFVSIDFADPDLIGADSQKNPKMSEAPSFTNVPKIELIRNITG